MPYCKADFMSPLTTLRQWRHQCCGIDLSSTSRLKAKASRRIRLSNESSERCQRTRLPRVMNQLDADTLSKAQALGLAARGIVEGLRVGDHRSPFRGFSVEFVQHREYVPGDDVRHIDWKSYARTERYTVKQYEQ